MSSDRPRPATGALRFPALSGLVLCAGLLLHTAPLRAQEAGDGDSNLESALLHRRIDLRPTKVYDPASHSWRPLQGARARVTVLNLWSRVCKPCIAEFPALRTLAEAWRPNRDVQFLFIADPPEETSEKDAVTFWNHPAIEVPANERCPGTRLPGGVKANCVIELPTQTPLHCGPKSLLHATSARLRPLTLLLDSQGVIRHVFAGSMVKRQGELTAAIERFLALRPPEGPGTVATRPAPTAASTPPKRRPRRSVAPRASHTLGCGRCTGPLAPQPPHRDVRADAPLL